MPEIKPGVAAEAVISNFRLEHYRTTDLTLTLKERRYDGSLCDISTKLRPLASPKRMDRYNGFKKEARTGVLDCWSANRSFKVGDLAVFYATEPVGSIVGIGAVDSEPYELDAEEGWDFRNSVFCDFRPMWLLEEPVPLKHAVKKLKLEAWWKTTPYQNIRRIPNDVANVLIRESVRLNPEIEPLMGLVEGKAVKTGKRPQKATVADRIHELELMVRGLLSTGKSTAKKTSGKTSKATPPAKNWTLARLQKLAGREFEEFSAELFKRRYPGADVKLTAYSGDFGVDVLIREKGTGETIVVQCKRWNPKKKTVGSKDVQVFGGGMLKYRASKGFFVTTTGFYPQAVRYAEDVPMELVNGKALVKMIKGCEGFPDVSEWEAMRDR